MNKLVYLILVSVWMLILVGCSDKSKAKPKATIATTASAMVQESPGTFAGNKFNEYVDKVAVEESNKYKHILKGL